MTPLEHLLDRVRDALIAGDLAALSGLDLRMMAEVDHFSLSDAVAVRRLHRKAERNARLLQAAARGLGAARHRMAEITSGPGLATYDAQGRKAPLVGRTQSLGRF